ncbi:hypothetical protein CRYUN_Cryun41cG0042000 [Craigia yunnanensis]
MEIEKEREVVQRIEHDFHEHPLVLVEEQSNQSEITYCSGCAEVVLGPCFSCTQCKYHLHKKCAEAPYEIGYHPLHRQHSDFFLRESPSEIHSECACAFCNEKRNMFFYECSECRFSLDIICANLFSNKIGENFPEFKDDAFQHLFGFIENPKEHGSCQCLKEDCNYIVHVNCATEDNDLYYIVNQENQVEELDENSTKAMDSSAACVIKKNKNGEATIIKHFYHKHNLLLEDKIKEDNDRPCDGGLFYKSRSPDEIFYFCLRCRKCTFALDFSCVTLPHAVQHKCDMHLLQLTYGDENDDVEEHYYNICEDKRDPSYWTESLCRIQITGVVVISFLSRRLMATLNASFAVSFVKINLSSVQNATIFATSNVGFLNSELYSILAFETPYWLNWKEIWVFDPSEGFAFHF